MSEGSEDDDLEKDWALLKPTPITPVVKPSKGSKKPVATPATLTAAQPTGVTVLGTIPMPPPAPPPTTRPTTAPVMRRPAPPPSLRSRIAAQITMARLQDFLWTLFLTTLAVGGLWVAYNGITASGKILDCYIEKGTATTSLYTLKGRVDWREDQVIGYFSLMDDALVAKKKACP